MWKKHFSKVKNGNLQKKKYTSPDDFKTVSQLLLKVSLL